MNPFNLRFGGSVLLSLLAGSIFGQQPRFVSVQRTNGSLGILTWTNAPGTNAFILQWTPALTGTWSYAPPPSDLTISTNRETTEYTPFVPPAGIFRLWQGFGPQCLHGTWMMLSAGTTNVGGIFFVSNGNGTLTNFGAYNLQNPPGSYSVSNDGAITLSIFSQKGTNQVNGQFVPPRIITAAGTSTNLFGTIAPVDNLSSCAGTWSGTLSETNDPNGLTDYAINLSVDTNGFANVSGDLSGTGWIFALAATNGAAAGFFTNTVYSYEAYNQTSIKGTLTGNTLSGTFGTDSGTGPSSISGTVTLTRQ